ncbi:S-layer homology domain-containing protein [Paenibacillus sp. JCM 10914]|uniref:S-layer homology domain-containing protein n=1 Tax=Paenibacillus sp. JCM 10914 TaxID=1236974 RepID=UPI0003CC699F|nr:S-layer homology domain-containing protein [Paenibacillus sp. JCM 10914]GAE07368.1 hypothetical protein JCM10914_3593 [Paenibacillus sp. JCM 10914]
MSGTEVGTVVGSVYDYTATGLVNGTTYYFTVKGENVQGESPASNIVSATPFTLPDAPTNVLAVAGNRQATINFDAPAFDGGSTITSYEVTADPGGLTATGTASPITFSGLTNGTTYTFTVKAINAGGKGAESMPSNPITPRVPSSDGGGVTPTPSPIPEPTPTPSKPKPPLTGIEVQIAGKVANQGTMSVVESSEEDRTTMVIYLDQSKLEEQLEATEAGSVVSVSVSKDTDDVYVELSGTQLEYLVRKQSVIELQIAQGIYRLPIQAIDVASIIAGLGEPVIQNDLTFRIGMGLPSEGTLKLARDAESMESFNLLGTPLDFTFQAIYGDDQREVVWFNQYVERLIKLPEGTSPNQVATAVVLNHDGTVRHVPTRIVMINGQSYAVVNSITNSTYALISHSLNFKDVHAQWAKTAANDLGARLIVHGDSHGRFHPEQEVTRAEFAAILVRGLGLGPNHNDKGFSYSDVNPTAWYSDAIQTAQAYHLIAGFEDGSFRPQDKLTREQAMSILAAAMKWTGLHDQLPAQPAAELLRPFADAGEAGLWARRAIADNLQAGIVTGRNEKTLAPKAFITRAEATVIVQRLLKESGFID